MLQGWLPEEVSALLTTTAELYCIYRQHTSNIAALTVVPQHNTGYTHKQSCAAAACAGAMSSRQTRHLGTHQLSQASAL
jgi:hypothetical protein